MAHVFENIKLNNLAIGRGFPVKRSVRVATTTAGTLATNFEDGDTIDGITLATDDRILIKDQVTGTENGIYVVQAVGSPIRAGDCDEGEDILGNIIAVEEGIENANTIWVVGGSGSTIVDTDSISCVNLSAKNIIIQEEGTNISNTPHKALNFIGTRITAADGGGGVANVTVAMPTTTKGDLMVFGTDDSRLPVGNNNYVLVADSTQPLGVRWGPVTTSVLDRDLQQATSTVIATTTSTTFVDLPVMTLTTSTIGMARYFIAFSGEFTVSNASRTVNAVLNIGGVDVTDINFDIGTSSAGKYTVISFVYVHSTPLASGVDIKIRWQINGGGGTISSRSRVLTINGVQV